MPMVVEPVVLEGSVVRLEPLGLSHAADLARNADAETFRFFMDRPIDGSQKAMAEFIRLLCERPGVLPFAVVHRESGEAVGITTYLDIRPEHYGLEIGFTWYGASLRGTHVNPECKLLLLRHAFEVLSCIRVQLKTDSRNLQSQAALRKLGAVQEGTLRRHLVMPDGHIRDTVMFSIVKAEWPSVRDGLLERLSVS